MPQSMCPHRLIRSSCPACLADLSDRHLADRLAATDPERETCRRDFAAWLAGLSDAQIDDAAFEMAMADTFTLPAEAAEYTVPDESEV